MFLITFAVLYSFNQKLMEESNGSHWVEINLGIYAAQFLGDLLTIRKLTVETHSTFKNSHVVIISLYSLFALSFLKTNNSISLERNQTTIRE